jgi:hypothetical protein
MNLIKYTCLLATVLLLACEKEVTSIKLPAASSQLVIHSFISPQDTLLNVYVTESRPVTGDRVGSVSTPVVDAAVILSDGERTIRMPLTSIFTGSRGDVYRVRAEAFPVVAGRTYFLEVSTPDGRRATAQCTVPEARATPEVLLDSAVRNDYGREFMQYTGKIRWQDYPGETNFYRVAGEMVSIFMNSSAPDQSVERRLGVNWEGNPNATFFSDSRLDGASFSSPAATFPAPTFMKSATLFLYLLTTDQAYFEYHRTLWAGENDNPFSEPVLIYSNIEGGQGIFSAFNRTTLELRLK